MASLVLYWDHFHTKHEQRMSTNVNSDAVLHRLRERTTAAQFSLLEAALASRTLALSWGCLSMLARGGSANDFERVVTILQHDDSLSSAMYACLLDLVTTADNSSARARIVSYLCGTHALRLGMVI